MSRNTATTNAAVNGLAGLVSFTIGGAVASLILASFETWVGFVPALVVWAFFGYFGMGQFAHGIYTIVEDATAGSD